MTAELYLIIAGGLLSAYVVIMSRLVRFIEPLRMELGQLGEQLILDDYTSAQQKQGIKEMLDRAYSPMPMLMLVLMMPFIGLSMMWDAVRGKTKPRLLTGHPETERDYDRFMGLFLASTAAANPVFALVFVVELVLAVLVAVIIGQQAEAVRFFIERVLRADMVVLKRTRSFAG